MAGRLHFAEGFDAYDELEFMNYYRRFSGTANSGTGVYHHRTGGYLTDGGMIRITSSYAFIMKPGAVPATGASFIFGCAMKDRLVSSAGSLFEFRYNDVEEISIETDSSGYLLVKRGATTIGTSSNTFNLSDGWHYLAFKVTLDNSTGSFELYMDHSLEASGSGLDTSDGGALDVNGLRMGHEFLYYDHQIWIADTGAVPTDDWIVQDLYPTGDGNHSDLAATPGANWANVDDADFDLDSSYNQSATVTNRDSYFHANPAYVITGAIEGIVLYHYIKNVGPGSRTVEPFLRQSATNYDQAAYTPALESAYRTQMIVIPDSPATATNFTPTEIDDLETGLEIAS